MTLIEIAFIYLALKEQDSQKGTEVFIKLILNLNNLPFIVTEKEKAFID